MIINEKEKKLDDTPPMPESDEEFVDIEPKPLLEGEEVKKETELKILTPNKLLTRFPVLLAQTKAESNSYKLKNEIRQILHLLYQLNEIIKKLYNNLIKSL